MSITKFAFVAGAALLLAGCSTVPTRTSTAANTVVTAPSPVDSQALLTPTTPPPAQATQVAMASTDVLNFLDPSALTQLSAKERSEASNAQFYALQFGRPGAPRAWSGDAGASGQVTVGPYVRVNNLDCRDFTHAVKVKGSDYSRKGTACREADGRWAVVGA